MSELIKELMPYLEKLADKLGTTAQYLWMLQMKQVYVELIGLIVLYLIIAALFYAVYRFAKFMREDVNTGYGGTRKRYSEEDTLSFVGTAVCIVVVVGGIIAVLGSIDTFLTLLINPDYWAVKNLVHIVK